MMRSLRQALANFLNPESAEVNLGVMKLKYTDGMRGDIALVLADLKKRRVLFVDSVHELWSYAFPSLRQLRDSLSGLSGRLITRGTSDVKAAVDFMVHAVNTYLALYEAEYERFMESDQSALKSLAPAHRERNWPLLSEAAADLITLRKLLYSSVQVLEQFASDSASADWSPPDNSVLEYWISYAESRVICPQCLFNMYYRDGDMCQNPGGGSCPLYPSDIGTHLFTLSLFDLKGYQMPNQTPCVEIAGTFTGWSRQTMRPARHAYGRFLIRCRVEPGLHRYKFIVDGNWYLDPHNGRDAADSSGNVNSIFQG